MYSTWTRSQLEDECQKQKIQATGTDDELRKYLEGRSLTTLTTLSNAATTTTNVEEEKKKIWTLF